MFYFSVVFINKMSTAATGKMSRAQRRAKARKSKAVEKRVQPVIVEPIASGQGKAIRAYGGHSVTKWTASCAAADAQATSRITITLPQELSSERNKILKVGRVMLWLGILPSVSGTVKGCVTETQSTPAAAFQIALAVADSTKDVMAAMYTEAFKGITLEQLASDLSIYLYSSVALAEADVVVHLEVEHIRPTFDDFFTPVF
nr:coat protein [Bromoviridae sp.]